MLQKPIFHILKKSNMATTRLYNFTMDTYTRTNLKKPNIASITGDNYRSFHPQEVRISNVSY